MNTLNLGYDMFDELKHNMNKADHFAHTLNCTRLEMFMEAGYIATAINELRFEIDESDVAIVVNFSYIREDEVDDDDFAKEETFTFTMDGDQVYGTH